VRGTRHAAGSQRGKSLVYAPGVGTVGEIASSAVASAIAKWRTLDNSRVILSVIL
jgi:hypothetical protein